MVNLAITLKDMKVDEVKARFMAFDACQGTLRKLKASGALRYAMKERGKELKGTI